MRIISGNLKGSTLNLPKNKNTRPLKDIAKESIFNLLTHSNKVSFQIEQSNVLDLYAGIGSFGLECLSRNAKFVYFIENEESSFKILERNIVKLKLKKKTKTFFNDVFSFIENHSIFSLKFDLIFCDPPFKNNNIDELINLIFNKNLLKKNGIIVIHRNKNFKEKLSNHLSIVDERIYGISKIIFGKL